MNNNEIINLLKNSIINNKILHSYMFVGGKFSLKKKIALEFSKHILCLKDEEKSCEACNSCMKFNSLNHPDFQTINLSDDENSIKIEKVRAIQEDIIKKPIISNKKIYIIENAETMTNGAQNCLLKTLEEPPLYGIIILLVDNESTILNTIKSRCTKILFTEELQNVLNEEDKELYYKLEEIFGNIDKYKLLDVLNKLDLIYKNEKNIFNILDYINDILYKKIKNNKENIRYIEYVEETKRRLKSKANYNMSIDNLLFNIWGNKD